MGSLTFVIGRSYLLDQREQGALRQSYLNARLVRSALTGPDVDVAALLTSLRPDGKSEIAVRLGERWYSTSVAVTSESIPSQLQAVVHRGGAAHQRLNIAGEANFVSAIAVPAAGFEYYELFPFAELAQTLRTLAAVLAVSAGVAAIAGVVVGLFASRRVMRPLRQVAATAGEIASGSLDRRLSVARDPDLSPLTDAFNEMVDALQHRIDREARFSSDVSHELRTPLAAMAAAMSVAERRRDTMPEDLAQVLDIIGDQITSFQALTIDLLEIARVDAGSVSLYREPIDPSVFARQLATSLGSNARVDTDLDNAVIIGDKRRLRQAFANLLTNAERYAGGADLITVSGTDDAKVRITVEDRGPGVADDERDRIFGRFARGEAASNTPSIRGSGLGLALTREHIELHGGRIWVEEREGGGARFVVELPTAPRLADDHDEGALRDRV